MRKWPSPMILFLLSAALLCLATSTLADHRFHLLPARITAHRDTIRLTGYAFIMLEMWTLQRRRGQQVA